MQHWHAESIICLHYFLDVGIAWGPDPKGVSEVLGFCVTLPLFLECCVQLWPIYANMKNEKIQEPKVHPFPLSWCSIINSNLIPLEA